MPQIIRLSKQYIVETGCYPNFSFLSANRLATAVIRNQIFNEFLLSFYALVLEHTGKVLDVLSENRK